MNPDDISAAYTDSRVELIHRTLARLSVGYPGPEDANEAHAALDAVLAEYDALREAAKGVVDFYPTVAGTAILIKNANTHVPRNPWDNVADAIYQLSRAVA